MPRFINRIAGAVYDIDEFRSLSDDNCNLIIVSDRLLYLLNNSVNMEMSWMSRYGYRLAGDLFLPITESEEVPGDYNLVYNTIDQLQGAFTDMNCIEEGFAAIVAAINSLSSTIAATGGGCCAPVGEGGDNGSATEGGSPPGPIGGITYSTPSGGVSNRHCKASYWVLDNLQAVVDNLAANNIDGIVSASLAVTSGLMFELIAVAAAAAFTATFLAVAGIVVGLAVYVLAGGVSMSGISALLTANRADLICALYTASTADEARHNFLTVLDGAGISTANRLVVSAMLPNGVLNCLFFDNTTGTSDEIDTWPIDGPCDCDCGLVWGDYAGNGGVGSGDLTPDGQLRTLTSSAVAGGFYWIYFAAPISGCTNRYDFGMISATFTAPDGAGFAIWDRVIPDGEVIIIEANDFPPPDNQGPLPPGEYQGFRFLMIADVPFTIDLAISNT